MRKKFLIAALLIALVLVSVGCTEVKEEYVLVDGGAALKRFEGKTTQPKYTVKGDFEGKPVVKLLEFSLANAEYLEIIDIGAGVTEIDPWALTNCNKLKNINVDPNNANYCSVDGVLYNKDKTVLLSFPNKNTPNFVVPSSVTEIAQNAFYKCSDLQTVTFPAGLLKIGDRAFQRATNLAPPALPAGLTSIGADAFSFFCSSDSKEFIARNVVKELFIPQSVVAIGEWAFNGSGLTLVKMERPSQEGIDIKPNWLPIKSGTLGESIDVKWGAQK